MSPCTQILGNPTDEGKESLQVSEGMEGIRRTRPTESAKQDSRRLTEADVASTRSVSCPLHMF